VTQITFRIAALFFAAWALHAAADTQVPPVPFGGILRVQFTLSAGGTALSGIPVTITPLNGCGTVAGTTSTVVTTNSNGTASFDFTAGHTVGNCRIEGRNGSTTGYVVTLVYDPATLQVTDNASPTSRVKVVPTSTTNAGVVLRATALDDRGVRQYLTNQPVGVQVGADDNGATASLHGVGNPVTGAATQPDGSVAVELDTNNIEGTYDLQVNVTGTNRTFRITQTNQPAAATSQAVTHAPLPLEPMTVSLSGAPTGCKLTSAVFQSPVSQPAPPTGRSGFFDGTVSVGWTGCPSTYGSSLTLRFDYAQAPPSNAVFYSLVDGVSTNKIWSARTTAVSGSSATMQFDPSGYFMGPIIGGLAMAGTAPTPARPAVKDLWWAGTQENGWGMSIVQSDDRSKLFPVIYAYDDAGNPTWWATDGWWDPASAMTYHTYFYHPRGTAWYAFDVSLEALGNESGKGELVFSDANTATLDYRINGRTGHKSIVRQPFGVPTSASSPDVGGMWWGGSTQSGWGISVAQQQATLFAVWYSYDDRGYPTWVVMPGGSWTSASTYEGRIYRTHASGWVGQAYDPSKLTVTDVGSYRFQFSGTSATFQYTLDGRSGTLALSRQAPF
jgi:hypothetical protein